MQQQSAIEPQTIMGNPMIAPIPVHERITPMITVASAPPMMMPEAFADKHDTMLAKMSSHTSALTNSPADSATVFG
jgi:hypothetical protein